MTAEQEASNTDTLERLSEHTGQVLGSILDPLLDARMAPHQDRVRDLDTKCKTLEKESKNQVKRHDDLAAEVETAKTEGLAREKEIVDATRRIGIAEGLLKDVPATLNTLREGLAQASARIEALEADLQAQSLSQRRFRRWMLLGFAAATAAIVGLYRR